MSEHRAEMLALRDKLMAEHPEITQASDFAPLMGDLEREYWDWKLEQYFAAQGGDQHG